MVSTASLLSVLPLLAVTAAQYTATYVPSNLPDKSEGEGQSGTNACGTQSSQTSMCQNLYVNSVQDFCLWGPPENKSDVGDGTSKIGNVEQHVVSYCLNDGYGTRLIPQGAIHTAHFVKVESDDISYVQVRGTGDFTGMNIPAGDDGGELDPHSWTGLGNPEGGLAFTNAFGGEYRQSHEWTSFMGAEYYCVRLCVDGPNAPGYCEHIYDVLSCDFTIQGASGPGFEECLGEPGAQPGVYDGSTFHQGDPTTPAAHPPAPSSMCTTYSSLGGSSINIGAVVTGSVSRTSDSASASMTSSVSSGSSSSASASASSSASSASASASSASASGSMSTASRSSSVSSVSRAAASGSATPSGAATRNAAGALGGFAALVAGAALL